MLYHHSDQAYDVAATEAARFARSQMEALLPGGEKAAQHVMEKVMGEVPVDYLVPAKAVEFVAPRQLEGDRVAMTARGVTMDTNKNSFSQVCDIAGLPFKFADSLRVGAYLHNQVVEGGEQSEKGWVGPLLAHNLNTLWANLGSRHLVRTVGNQVRGVLSDSYRRLDSRPLLEAFGGACQAIGAVPVAGVATQTRVSMKAMLPMVFEPVPNEVLCMGVEWSNSDYGCGANNVRVFMLRLWCTNFAIGEELMRNVHLGRKLPDNIRLSQKTYDLDTQTTASALVDQVKYGLAPETVHGVLDRIKRANAEAVAGGKSLVARLGRLDLSKAESTGIADMFDSEEVRMLPAGNTSWRLSNAISWFAGTRCPDHDRQNELQRLAGKVLPAKVA